MRFSGGITQYGQATHVSLMSGLEVAAQDLLTNDSARHRASVHSDWKHFLAKNPAKNGVFPCPTSSCGANICGPRKFEKHLLQDCIGKAQYIALHNAHLKGFEKWKDHAPSHQSLKKRAMNDHELEDEQEVGPLASLILPQPTRVPVILPEPPLMISLTDPRVVNVVEQLKRFNMPVDEILRDPRPFLLDALRKLNRGESVKLVQLYVRSLHPL